MRQRDLIVLLGGAATWPLGARAQTVPVIGILGSAVPQQWTARLRAFREGLGEMGYVEGRNVVMEYRWAEGHNERLPALAADLVALKPAVIVVLGNTHSAVAAKGATDTIPIVFRVAVDPVEFGLVDRMNQPSGNLTGVTTLGVRSVRSSLSYSTSFFRQQRPLPRSSILATPALLRSSRVTSRQPRKGSACIFTCCPRAQMMNLSRSSPG